MSYDRFDSQRRRGRASPRSALGYWVPLAVTVTVATIGLAAWIWKERSESDEYYDDDHGAQQPPPSGYGGYQGPPPPGYAAPPETRSNQPDDEGMVARMSGALRRTPSPQQLLDGARTRVAAGVAAAGAVVGGALSSIREEDRGNYEDHSRWSEEAEARNATRAGDETQPTGPGANAVAQAAQTPAKVKANDKRKTVAIVISAEVKHEGDDEDASYLSDHASILSHLPEHIDADSRVFILIYAPSLQSHPSSTVPSSSKPAPSSTSSYSHISHDELHTPADESAQPLTSISPAPLASPSGSSRTFKALYQQAQALVEADAMIMPFTTLGGYVHMLRHVAPDVVYVQTALAGPRGEAAKHVAAWVGQVVLVVGDEGGHGGLVDSEDEGGASGAEMGDGWWRDDARVGLGKGIEVVEGMRVGEDWRRRVGGHD